MKRLILIAAALMLFCGCNEDKEQSVNDAPLPDNTVTEETSASVTVLIVSENPKAVTAEQGELVIDDDE